MAGEPLEQFVRLTAGLPRQRRIDAASAEAAVALQQAGIAAVLLKGRAVADWLYADGGPRWYGDCDLLLREADVGPAGDVLTELGYRRRPSPPDDPGLVQDVHSIVWARDTDRASVELHWTLIGLTAGPALVWEALSQGTSPIVVGGIEMRSLGEPGRALHLALHLAQHGRVSRQPVEDLRRGVDQLDFRVWARARELSARLGGDAAFAAGLCACPGGVELAARLALPPATRYWTLRAEGAPRGTLRLHQIRDASGWRARWGILTEGLSRYREFRDERGHLSGLARMRESARDLVAAIRALMRSR